MEPLVSIIVPCYNGEKYIGRCLQSICNQTYDHLQVICVNDGSTDQSESVIINWKKRFEAVPGREFIYLYQENSGVGSAVKAALTHVIGKYLTLIDADDMFMADSIEKRVYFLENNPEYALVRTNGFYVQEGQDPTDEPKLFITAQEEKEEENIFDNIICGRTNNWAGSYMVRVEILQAFYKQKVFFASRYGQNMQILLPVAYQRKSGFIDEPLMKYILQKASLSREEDDSLKYEKLVKNQEGFSEIRRRLINDIVDVPHREKYMNLLSQFHWHSMFNYAVMCKRRAELKTAYQTLKSNGWLQFEEKVVYFRTNKSIRYYMLFAERVFRKFKEPFNAKRTLNKRVKGKWN